MQKIGTLCFCTYSNCSKMLKKHCKAAHKILLLVMERQKVSWKDNNKIHQIRGTHSVLYTLHRLIRIGVLQNQLFLVSFTIMATAYMRANIWMDMSCKNMHVHIAIEWSEGFVITLKLLVTGNK